MKLYIISSTTVYLLLTVSIFADAQTTTTSSSSSSSIVQVDGTGTSNPSKCFWSIMEKIQIQSKIPTRLTYRSTSTGPGQRDFVGNGTHPFSTDFASGDYPMTPDNYQLLQSHNVEMIHVPVLLGAIGVFHSVPVEEGTYLNLTACLIAQIYTHEIRDWNHPDIKALNPALSIPTKYDSYGNIDSDQSYPITVAGRSAGSSSTNTFTSYLNKACPDVWPVDMVGSTVDFHPSTKICPSNTLAQCVAETPGTIFYIDSGIGKDGGLDEVALKMNVLKGENDFFLTSIQSIDKGGILSAVDEVSAGIPTSADADWSNVDLVYQVESYIYTWPMVQLTYIYVRKDLPSFIPDPRAQGLLVAFLKSMFNPLYNEECETRYHFVAVTGALQELALEAIDLLQTSSSSVTPTWIIESSDILEDGIGMGDYVLSTRRESVGQIQQNYLLNSLEDATTKVDHISSDLKELRLVMAEALNETWNVLSAELEELMLTQQSFDQHDQKQLNASFVMSILALCLCFVLLIVICRQQRTITELRTSMSAGSVLRPAPLPESSPHHRKTSSQNHKRSRSHGNSNSNSGGGGGDIDGH